MSNDMTIEQVNAAIAEFDERCKREDVESVNVRLTTYRIDGYQTWVDEPPPYASDIALLWPVVERVNGDTNNPFSIGQARWHHCYDAWVCAVEWHDDYDDNNEFELAEAPTSTEALARAVAWVAGEMKKEMT